MPLPLKRDGRFHQGIYRPSDKCLNGECVFRSGLELKFMRWCDSNPNVIEWGSECITIPYYDPVKKKNRKYFVDNYVKIREGDVIRKYLVEIKPHKQTIKPVSTRGKSKKNLLYESLQWETNSQKWESARKFAKKNGMEFIIITEKELN